MRGASVRQPELFVQAGMMTLNLFGYPESREIQIADAGGGGGGNGGGGGGGGDSRPFVGVMSLSKEETLGIFNMKNHYDQWCFTVNSIDPNIVTIGQLRMAMMTAPEQKRPKFSGAGKNLERGRGEAGSGSGGSSSSAPPPADEPPPF
jgi:hypothetical protein